MSEVRIVRTRKARMRAIYATHYLRSYIGKWYKWGGDGPVFDCSGYVNEGFKAFGMCPRGKDRNSRMIAGDACMGGLFIPVRNDGPVHVPSVGEVVFFADSPQSDDMTEEIAHIRHIEWCVNDWQTIGASGGGSKTLTMKDAIKHRAFIKVRPLGRNRRIVGFADFFGTREVV